MLTKKEVSERHYGRMFDGDEIKRLILEAVMKEAGEEFDPACTTSKMTFHMVADGTTGEQTVRLVEVEVVIDCSEMRMA